MPVPADRGGVFRTWRRYVCNRQGVRLVACDLAAAKLRLGGACCCTAPPSAETVRVYPGPSSERLDPASSCTSVRARPYAHYSALPGSRVATYFAGTRSIFRQGLHRLTSTNHSRLAGQSMDAEHDSRAFSQRTASPVNDKQAGPGLARLNSLLSASYRGPTTGYFPFECFLERGHDSSGSEYERFPELGRASYPRDGPLPRTARSGQLVANGTTLTEATNEPGLVDGGQRGH